jgi:branched-chain amino acid transport system substrate-binding protein
MEEKTETKKKPLSKNAKIVIAVVIVIIVILAAVSAVFLTQHPAPPPTIAAPSEILIGTLYASTGAFTSMSIPGYYGLLLWEQQVNANGGIYLSSYGKKIPVKIIAYDDHSDPSTAETEYSELITVNHVNLLLADQTSVLTAPAVSIAESHHVLLIDQSGTSKKFFTTPSPYIVLTSVASTDYYFQYIVPLLLSLNITKIAIAYGENDFEEPGDADIVAALAAHNITPVYNQGFSNSLTEFSSIITTVASLNPQAFIFLGYTANEIAYINQLHSLGIHFPFMFAAYPTQMFSIFEKDCGTNMSYFYSFGFPPLVNYGNVSLGYNFTQFNTIWNSTYPNVPLQEFSYLGYTTGIMIQAALQQAGSLNTTAIRNAFNSLSGNVHTLMGTFIINTTNGEQEGMAPPIMQVVPNGVGGLKAIVVWPLTVRTGTPIYPAPS